MGIRKKRGLCYIARFRVPEAIYIRKMGLAFKAYLMGACISEGAFLYSKIWDFTYCCHHSQSRWRWRNKALSSHNCTLYCVHIPIHQVSDDQGCYIAGSPTCSSHRFG